MKSFVKKISFSEEIPLSSQLRTLQVFVMFKKCNAIDESFIMRLVSGPGEHRHSWLCLPTFPGALSSLLLDQDPMSAPTPATPQQSWCPGPHSPALPSHESCWAGLTYRPTSAQYWSVPGEMPYTQGSGTGSPSEFPSLSFILAGRLAGPGASCCSQLQRTLSFTLHRWLLILTRSYVFIFLYF